MKQTMTNESTAHVVKFASGKFRGSANMHVDNIMNATLYTRSEAKAKANQYDQSTGAIAVPFHECLEGAL